jgi:uncharacterized repeat protein (TIGR01451 family)
VLVNGNFTYTLSVSNAANAGTANNVQPTDTLPSGVTLNGTLPPGCTSAGTNPVTVTCNLGTIAPGQTENRTINVTAPGTPGTLDNRARVTSSTDPKPNDSNIEQTTVLAEADLTITKTDSEDPVLVNGNFSYTLSVRNTQGAGTATNVVVTDTLPAGVTLNEPLPGGCTSTTGADGRITVTCDLGTLNAGQTASRTIDVTAGEPPRTLSNTVTVSSPRDRTDSSDTEQTTVVPAADLSLTKTDSPDPAVVGELLTYTLTVTNNGPSGASGVIIRDTLPANATFVSASSGCTESAGVVTCNVGDLASGASVSREIAVRPTAPGALNNEATVTSDTADPNEGNDTATATTQVNAAELSISKTDSPDPVTYGNDLTYEVSVNNNGPASATNVQVTGRLPNNVTTFISASDGCTYDAGNHRVTCGLGTINSSDPAVTRQIVVSPTAAAVGTTLTNRATISSPNDPTDSTAIATTQVIAAALWITKTDSEDPVFAGENFTYIIEVENVGTADATNVQVTDPLPNDVTFVSAPDCDYDATDHRVTCDLGTMNSGVGPVERRITVTAPAERTTLRNTATVRSPNDPRTAATPSRPPPWRPPPTCP